MGRNRRYTLYLFSLKPRSALDLAFLGATQGPLSLGTSQAAKTDSAFHLLETVIRGGKAEHVPESQVIGMKMTAGRVFYIFFFPRENLLIVKKTTPFLQVIQFCRRVEMCAKKKAG